MFEVVTGGITGECLSCEAPQDQLGETDIYPTRDLEAVLKILDSFEADPAGFLQACSEAGIKPLINPFWKNLSYANIYCSITLDISIIPRNCQACGQLGN